MPRRMTGKAGRMDQTGDPFAILLFKVNRVRGNLTPNVDATVLL